MTAADLVLVADALHGTAGEALAVAGGRIVAIGDRSDAAGWSGVGTRTLRLPGIVSPGLVDAHTHPVLGARMARGIDLREVRTLDELRSRLAAARRDAGEWILGWGLSHDVWAGAAITAEALDDAVGDVPTLLRMFDAHSALASSAALARAGVTGRRTFASGAHVDVDDAGTPTGFLHEHEAIDLIECLVPLEPASAVAARLAGALEQMASVGLTGAHVMDFEGDPAALYAAVESEDRMPLRLRIHPWVDPASTPDDWEALIAATGTGGASWRRHGVKLFLDGTIDNGTAWLTRPDRDGRSVRSTWPSPSRYAAAIARFAAAGVPTATHAIGDAAVRHAAASIADARAAHPGSVHRIEHLELTGDDVVAAVARSGAVASMQPTHCTRFVRADRSDNWSTRVGADRAEHSWRTRSLADGGVTLALGSDWPIAPFDPREILVEAQTRRHGAAGPIGANEALTAAQAFAAFTTGAAVAAGCADDEGRIAVGMRADLTVLSADPSVSAPEEVAAVGVHATVVDGRVRYLAG
ncbi:amidohydrolase family protein [Microbacterium hominis]|uniref:amidohydrolase n=1 Tax=Microbacterium TaxID=33882 RepID=UPI00168BBAF7|nr:MULTISPECIES: amidohydrolase family protein [Microbacterium]QOC27082.1 amidohydrolase family protein [Microbacterium hominis]QOC28239.1 amidohydrolase family protein [Microbacterium hominis]QYF96582.1 amidohydrolase family protein [Microbacterium sp. PAMC21962]